MKGVHNSFVVIQRPIKLFKIFLFMRVLWYHREEEFDLEKMFAEGLINPKWHFSMTCSINALSNTNRTVSKTQVRYLRRSIVFSMP